MIRILSLSAIVFLFLLVCISPSMPLFGVFVVTFAVLVAVNLILWKRSRTAKVSLSMKQQPTQSPQPEQPMHQPMQQPMQQQPEQQDSVLNPRMKPLPSKVNQDEQKSSQGCFGKVLTDRSKHHTVLH